MRLESALAISFTTTLTPSNPTQQDFVVTSAVSNWETNATSGNITSANVTNLTLQLFGAGNSLLFTDAMIVNGVAQAIGGVSRNTDDILWDFDLDNLTLSSFDNDLPVNQVYSAGTIYNVYGTLSGFFMATQRNNGYLNARNNYFSFSQTTTPQAQPVPEPVTILGTLLGGGLGVALKKKTKVSNP